MIERIFVGWERPFLGLAVDWLWSRREDMARMLVVVPTAQSGRRLRLGLAERGACLSPKVVTPGFFLRTPGAHVAPDALELVAWVEVLESISDWGPYQAVFPRPPGVDEEPGWSLGLAKSLARVRTSLQECAMTVNGAARCMQATVEADRWQALSMLERDVEATLDRWGVVSRSRLLAQGAWQLPDGVKSVVLAGVADAPAAVVRVLRSLPAPVISLIGAPAEEDEVFDEIGRPLADKWNGRNMPWPGDGGGSVTVVADPGQQALEAVRLVAVHGTSSDRLALGAVDEEAAGELVRAFGRNGWVAHDPSHMASPSLIRWFGAWRKYVSSPDLAGVIDLLGFVETEALVGTGRARMAHSVSSLRAWWLCTTADDAKRMVPMARYADELDSSVVPLMAKLESWRGKFLHGGFVGGMDALLAELGRAGVDTSDISDWLAGVRDVAARSRRDAGFWLDVMTSGGFEQAPEVPQDRVLDVQGWLELFHEPGPHLVLCGMNEGSVPGRADGDPWLSEKARRLIGLSTDASRAARDAYLFTSMVESRRAEGRVDVLLGKSSAGGDALLPSRLLLATEPETLPGRVEILFCEVEPPDAGLKWVTDGKWIPRVEVVVPRLSVTAFGDYLACPFRYYLKHGLKMSQPEPERREWDAREFGTIMHIVLEHWGTDEEARAFSKSEAIERWVCDELERLIAERYGKKPPLALRIQAEGMRQRLAWFARKQACEAAEGWRVENIEHKFELDLGACTIVGKVDRIDRHADGRKRVVDYKTRGKLEDVESMHRTAIIASTRWPAHLVDVEAVRCMVPDKKGKLVEKRWKNLQMALYSGALGNVDEVGYFGLGATENDVGLRIWQGFGEGDQKSARACAEWVAGQVINQVFWPPAEKSTYDDYAILSMGRKLEDLVAWQGKGGVA